jgi:O-antigen/teichoic acid export membrane protein
MKLKQSNLSGHRLICPWPRPKGHEEHLMGARGQTVLKNAGALLVSQAITWTLTLALTVFLPRYLGATNVGRLFLANSLWAVAAVAVTFGMDVHLTKEIARQPDRLRRLLVTTFALRGILFVLGLAGVLLYALAAGYPRETLLVVCIVAGTSLFNLLNNACQAALQGIERMEYIAAGNIAGKVVYSLLALGMLFAGFGLYEVAAVGALGALVTLLVELRMVLRLAPLPAGVPGRGPRPARDDARRMLSASLPYLVADASLVAYMQADVLILAWLLNERAIGWYGAANQLFGTFLFVPTILMTAIFPALSRLHATEPDTLRQYMQRSFDLLIVLGVPIGLGLVVVADPLVILLFGQEFANSGPILAVLGVVLILTFQNMLVGRFLVATDRQRQWTAVQATLGLATIPLDLVLVPWCQRAFANGALGGALSYIVTEVAMLITGIVLLPRGSLNRGNASVALRSLVAGLVMLATAWWTRQLFLAIPILVGAVVYVAALWLLGAVPSAELGQLWHLAISGVQRIRGRKTAQAVATREL